MDVFLSGLRIFCVPISLVALALAGCGQPYNIETQRGRDSRINDANYHLSRGECALAAAAIDPLYLSRFVTDEIRIIKASTTTCFARYNLLGFVSNIAGSSNFFQSIAKSMDNVAGDGMSGVMYSAVDIITQGGAVMNASSRPATVNTYMVFLQLGVMSTIFRNYGSPSNTGAQGADLIYSTAGSPAGEMSNQDACALGAAISTISDSFGHADLSDSDTRSLISTMESVCVSAGLASCAVINRNIALCDGTNAQSVTAQSLVTAINASW